MAALGLQTVENGVLHQRLQRKAGDHAVPAKPLVLDPGNLDLQIAAIAVLLDGKVIVEQSQLLLQGHQLLRFLGDALGQPGKGCDHFSDAGRMLDGGHPADAVEGVVDKVGVHLVLQHPVFQLLFFALVLHPAGHQAVHIGGQLVDASANVAQLIGPLYGRVGSKVAAAHSFDPLLQGLHRAGNGPFQPMLHQKAQSPHDGKPQPQQPQIDTALL